MLDLRQRAKKLPSMWIGTLALVALLGAAGCSDDDGNADAGSDASVDSTGSDTSSDSTADVSGDGPADAGSDAIVPCDLASGAKGIECGGNCIDPLTNPSHCGACDDAVGAGHVCYGGVERDSCPQIQEAFGIEMGLCDGRCTALKVDPANCGACGNACPATQICFNGACHCKVDPSELPEEDLDTYEPDDTAGRFRDCSAEADPPSCVDTWTDPANCGGCAGDDGTACASPQGICESRINDDDERVVACVSDCADDSMTSCAADTTCVDVAADLFNCGACGNACDGGRMCSAEGDTPECACPGEFPTECGGQCVDTATDVANCGGCATEAQGAVCGGSTLCQERDDNGTPVFECVCPANRGECGGSCVNLQNDSANCTECDNACTSNLSCQGGECRCPEGFRNCGDPDQCTDMLSDPFNCGTCGNACANDQTCDNGECVVAACTGTNRKACAKEINSVTRTGCVNTATDITNCGDCGVTCRRDQICDSGACACQSPTSACDGTCVNMDIDPNHCGDCTTVCAAGQVCTKVGNEEKATCKSKCPEGTTLCSGRCVDPAADNENCGQCGVVCLASGAEAELCRGGECTPIEDVDGLNCDGDNQAWCYGACVDLQAAGTPTSPNLNCGVCGNPCSRVEICQESQADDAYICQPRDT